MKGYMRI